MRQLFMIAVISCGVFSFASQGFADEENGFFTEFTHIDTKRWELSNGWSNGDHQSCEWLASAATIQKQRLHMELSARAGKVRPIACPEIHTRTRLGFGLYETRMRAAAGSGLNTAFFTYIGPPVGVPTWDEIDFEFLGKDPSTVQINYYVNGDGHHGVIIPLGFDATKALHHYAIDWAKDKIRWYIDGKLVHETPKDTVLPHTPARLYLSLWSGSATVDDWLGPFHYTAPVSAEFAWVGFTPAGKSCLFPQSQSCR